MSFDPFVSRPQYIAVINKTNINKNLSLVYCVWIKCYATIKISILYDAICNGSVHKFHLVSSFRNVPINNVRVQKCLLYNQKYIFLCFSFQHHHRQTIIAIWSPTYIFVSIDMLSGISMVMSVSWNNHKIEIGYLPFFVSFSFTQYSCVSRKNFWATWNRLMMIIIEIGFFFLR